MQLIKDRRSLNVVRQCTGIEKVVGLDGEWIREHIYQSIAGND